MDKSEPNKPRFGGISVPSLINRSKDWVGEGIQMPKLNLMEEIKARKTRLVKGKSENEDSSGSSQMNDKRFVKSDDKTRLILKNDKTTGLRNRKTVLFSQIDQSYSKDDEVGGDDDGESDEEGEYSDDDYENNDEDEGENNVNDSSKEESDDTKTEVNVDDNNKLNDKHSISDLVLAILPLSESENDDEVDQKFEKKEKEASEDDDLSQIQQTDSSNNFDFVDTDEIIEYEEDFDENVGYCESDFDDSYSFDSQDEDDIKPVNESVSLDDISENVPNYVNRELVKFYMENFNKRVCTRFVFNPADKENEKCFCGYAEAQHHEYTTPNVKFTFDQNAVNNTQQNKKPVQKEKFNSQKLNNINVKNNKADFNNNLANNASFKFPSNNADRLKTNKPDINKTDDFMQQFNNKKKKKKEAKWDVRKDTKTSPTNAFGEIHFGQKVNAKYLRLDECTDIKLIIKLMTQMWKIDKPKLIISMKGGEGKYQFDNKKRIVFWEGLGKTSVSANAWIFSDGFNSGVSKETSDAIQHYYSNFGRKNKINCIGITPWGCVNHREILQSEKGYGSWPVPFITLPGEEKENEWQIATGNTHFLFVDNSTQHSRGYQKDFRAKIEQQVAALDASRNSSSLILPIVTIVLEGDLKTLQNIAEDVDCSIPVILIAGSGGMTDVIVFAYNNCVLTEVKSKDNLDRPQSKLVSIYQEETFEKVEEMIGKLYNCQDAKQHSQTIRKIVDNIGLLSVFRAEDVSSQGDLDIIILKAVLKTNQMKPIEQLKLALMLDRVDVAREEIYTQDITFEIEDLNDLLFRALLEDNTGFVKLILEKGINLNLFLTAKRLLELYNHPITLKRNKYLYKVAKKLDFVSLKHVGKLIYEMTNEDINHIYTQVPYKNVFAHDFFPARFQPKKKHLIAAWHKLRSIPTFQNLARRATGNMRLFEPVKHETDVVFDDVSQEIFLWAALACKTEISLIFWERSSSPMFLAMLGQYITRGLDENENNDDMKQEYLNQIETFDKLAHEVLNECYEADQRKATLLLICPHKSFEDITLLDMAEKANNESFVKHFIVQKLLTNLWFGNIDPETNYIVIIIMCFFPILAPFVLKYRKIDIKKFVNSINEEGDFEEDSYGSNDEKEEELETGDKNKNHLEAINELKKRRQRFSSQASSEPPVPKNKRFSCFTYVANYFKKFFLFFQTPVIKFCYHAISHLCMLILFSYILLTNFFPEIQWFEIILTFWVWTITLEEIRQLSNGNTSSLRLLLVDYVTDVWNVMDFISISFFQIGFVLRMIDNETCPLCFYSGRIMLSLSLLMYCLRVLRFLSLHPALGPFLVMIQKMLIHIFYFFVIVIIMVLAFGVATTTIRFPNNGLNYNMFLDVFLGPWFGIQQAFLEYECSENANETSATTCAVEGYPPEQCLGREENCVANEIIPDIMSAFYILLTNVMMLNLLIAMISDTYTEVSGKTELVWSMQRLQLIKEYHERPSLPPPFILFEHIYLICRLFCPTKTPTLEERNKFDFSIDLPNLVMRDLLRWEMSQTETYLRTLQMDVGETLESKMQETCKRVESMELRMSKYGRKSVLSNDPPQYSNLDLSFAPDFPPNLSKRFAYVENELNQSMQYLEALLSKFRTKSSSRRRAMSTGSALSLTGSNIGKQIAKEFIEAERADMKLEFGKNLEQHIVCRENFSYENTVGRKVYRVLVADSQVSWDVEFPHYKPETFTDPIVFETPFADEDLITNPSLKIAFNQHEDGLRTRLSMLGTYQVRDGLPLNPKGRTGLQGRGVLSRWGPNRINKAIYVRWEDLRTSDGLKRLEFLTKVKNDEVEVFNIPERLNVPDSVPVYECLYPLITNILHESGIRWLLDNEVQVYKGYLDDPRNTDNAWLEVVCHCYPEKSIQTSGIDRDFEFTYSETENMKWKRINPALQMFGSDLVLLSKVVKLSGAYF